MAFTNTDILTLAKAGFTAEQIAALNMVGTQPAPAPLATQVTQPQPQPAQVTQPQPQPAQVTQPQPTQPAQVTQPQPLPIMVTPQAQPTQPQPAPQAATVDDVLKAINGLNTTMQNGFLQGSQQPTPPTAESILAEIINPPTKESK